MKKMILMVMILLLPMVSFAENCDTVDVYLPELRVASNESFTVEVSIPESVNGCNVEGYQFEVHFDPNVMFAEGYDVTETMSDGMMIVPVIDNENGYIRIGAYGLAPLTGNGTLINLNFMSQNEGATDLTFENYRFNSGTPEFVPHNGFVFVCECGVCPPKADFMPDVISGVFPLTVNFTDQSITGSETIISRKWDFDNDGVWDTIDEEDPQYIYNEPGNYFVKLKVSECALSDSIMKYVIVKHKSYDVNQDSQTDILDAQAVIENFGE